MNDAGEELAGNPVQRRHHQHQALAGGVAGGEGPRLQRAVHGPAGPGLALHLHEAHALAEDVFHPVGGPGVHMLRHGAGGRDGVDGRDLGKGVACVGGGLVAVHGLAFHKIPLLSSARSAGYQAVKFICLLSHADIRLSRREFANSFRLEGSGKKNGNPQRRVPKRFRDSSARKSGWAMAMRARARSRTLLYFRSATPYSVTTYWTQVRGW